MQKPKIIITGSICLTFIIAGIVLLDLAGTFSFSDVPFGLAFLIFFVFMIIQKGTSKMSFLVATYFLICTGLSYIQTGTSVISERLGEWFYLFFLAGAIQYVIEAWNIKDFQKQDTKTDWNSYYTNRIESNKKMFRFGTGLQQHL